MVNGGIVNDGLTQNTSAEEAIPDGGYVLMPGTLGTQRLLCTHLVRPVGLSYKSTKDPHTDVAVADVNVGITGLVPGLAENLTVPATNLAIAVNDILCVSSTDPGMVDKKDGVTNNGVGFAMAMEAVAINTGGTIKCLILPHGGNGLREVQIPLVGTKQIVPDDTVVDVDGQTLWTPAGWDESLIEKVEVEVEYAIADTGNVDLYDYTGAATVKVLTVAAAVVAKTVARFDVTTEVLALTVQSKIGLKVNGDVTPDTATIYGAKLIVTLRGV